MERCATRLDINHEISVPYTPQHNGLAKGRLLDAGREVFMAFGCRSGKRILGRDVAPYLVNRSLNRTTKMIPEEIWSGNRPNMKNLKIFGTSVIQKKKRTKWDAKARKTIFVGYADDQKKFRCFDTASDKIMIGSIKSVRLTYRKTRRSARIKWEVSKYIHEADEEKSQTAAAV